MPEEEISKEETERRKKIQETGKALLTASTDLDVKAVRAFLEKHTDPEVLNCRNNGGI